MKKHLIDGKAIAVTIEQDLITRVSKLKKKGTIPKLAVILVGKDKPSQTYVRKKGEAAQKAGMAFKLHKINSTITTKQLIKKIEEIQNDKDLSGIIVQLPLRSEEH